LLANYRYHEAINVEGRDVAITLTFLFLAAVVGIFRPYKFFPQAKRWHYGVGAFLLLIGIGVAAPPPETASSSSSKAGATATTTAPESTTTEGESATPSPLPSKWAYDSSEDQMRGSVRRFATLRSDNTIDFDFPYGEQPGIITVRQDPQYGLDVMFSLPSGQILCHGFNDSYINAKFDDGPIRRFNCTDSSDGTSEVAFLTDPRTFLSALKKADRTVIEAEFYQAGRQQYVFETRGLEWSEGDGRRSSRSQ